MMRQQVLPDEFGPVMRMLPPLLSVRSLGTGRAPVQLCSGSMASRKRKVTSSVRLGAQRGAPLLRSFSAKAAAPV